jgi:hypothetical protein
MLEASMKMKLFYPVRPWENEPDHAEWIQEPSGYKCRIMRNEITGTLCGYVGIPEGHTFWGEEYNSNNDEIDAIADDVHGGLTYSKEERDGYWYFGFDTSHSIDFAPKIIEMLIRVGKDKEPRPLKHHDCMNYRTWEYVENEIHWLGKRLWSYDRYNKMGCRNV